MMIASAQRQNDRTTVHRVEVVCQRAVPCDSQASVAIFPRWKSRLRGPADTCRSATDAMRRP